MDTEEKAGLASFLLAVLGLAALLPFFLSSPFIPWPVHILFHIPAFFIGIASRRTILGKIGLAIAAIAFCIDAVIIYIGSGME